MKASAPDSRLKILASPSGMADMTRIGMFASRLFFFTSRQKLKPSIPGITRSVIITLGTPSLSMHSRAFLPSGTASAMNCGESFLTM